jgi:hypothetical protein
MNHGFTVLSALSPVLFDLAVEIERKIRKNRFKK